MPFRQTKPRPSSDSTAFTLVELLIVMLILGIIGAMVIPQMGSAADMQVVSAARLIASDLQYAQNVAITSQTPTTVTFDVTGNSYRLRNASGTLIHPINKHEYLLDFETTRGFSRVSVASASFDGDSEVTFDETGAPDVPGVITISAGDCVYRIEIAAATGRVTIVDGS